MSRATWKIAIALLWLGPLAVALRYWQVWNALPARMASHFDLAGNPNSWMPREISLLFALGMMAAMSITGTAILLRVRKPELLGWSVLGMFYVMEGVFYRVEASVLNYSLYGKPIEIRSALLLSTLAALWVIVVALGGKRGRNLPTDQVIARETHAAPLWSLVLLLPTLIVIGLLTRVPVVPVKIALCASALLMFAAAAAAWSGFQYVFTQHGLEISTLGFRLRSIPVSHIRHYAPGAWSPLGGYGIRGIGEKRGYVWGNKGVRIQTSDGEVFLGHSHPERIVHDLDVIKQFSQ